MGILFEKFKWPLMLVIFILSVVTASYLSQLSLTAIPYQDLGRFGYTGLKGLPVPYEYTKFSDSPNISGNPLFLLDFAFWVILFNLWIFSKVIDRK